LWNGHIIDDGGSDIVAPAGTFYIVAQAFSDFSPSGLAVVQVNIVRDSATDLSITSVAPDSSDYAGAFGHVQREVIIYGSGFVEDETQVLAVYFEGVKANIIGYTETAIRVDVPHLPPTLPEGPVSILVELTADSDGAFINSATRDDLFTVFDSEPQVTINSPLLPPPGNVGDGVVIMATPIDDKGITEVVFEVTFSGTTITLATLTPGSYPYSIVWDMVDMPPPGGFDELHTITVRARDGENTEAISSVSVTPRDGTGVPFVNAPVVEITSHSNGDIVKEQVAIIFTVTYLTSTPHAVESFSNALKTITLVAGVDDVMADYPPGPGMITIYGATEAANNGAFTVMSTDVVLGKTVITISEDTLVDEALPGAIAHGDPNTIFVVDASLRILDSGTGLPLVETLTVSQVDMAVDTGPIRVETYVTDVAWDTLSGLDGSFYLIEATATDNDSRIGVGGTNLTVDQSWVKPRKKKKTDGVCGGVLNPGAELPTAWLIAMLLGAIPFMALRRARRVARVRVR
jgi:hypothetical protein